MAYDEKSAEAVRTVIQRFEIARRHMEPQLAEYRRTINAYLNKGPILDPFAISVKLGRLMRDLEVITSRDVRSLLGATPYFPYEAVMPQYMNEANAITDIVDHFTTQQTPFGDYYTAFTDALHICRPYGKAYIWPHWGYWPVSIYQRIPVIDPVSRQVMGPMEIRSIDVEQAMVYGVLHPWQVFPSPFGESLHAKPWIIIQLRAHVSELIPRLDRKIYHLKRDGRTISWEDLTTDGGAPADRDNAESQLRRDSGFDTVDFSDDVGTVLIYIENPTKDHPAGREIHIWNYRTELYNEDRSDWNMPLFQKPIVDLNHIMHIGPDRYHGIGLWSIMRDRVLISEEALSIFIDHVLRTSTGMLMYDPNVIKESQLLPTIAGRVPVPGGNFDTAVRPLEFGQINPKLIDISQMMERSVDDADGINDYVAGAPLDRKELATVATLQSSAAQARIEHYASYIERTALQQIGMMTPKIVDRHMTDYHKTQILGPERAAQLSSVDPAAIPGGYRIRFQASDRIRNREQRFSKSERALNLLGNILGVAGKQLLARELLKSIEGITAEDLDRIVAEIGQLPGPPMESLSTAGMTANSPSQTPLPTPQVPKPAGAMQP